MRTILITDKVHPLLIEGLLNQGFSVDHHSNMSYEEVSSVVHAYDGIIINSKVVCDREFIDKARHLDFIGRLGSGLDIIDLPYARQRGIEVISSPEGNANAVAEHTMGMLLSLQQKIYNASEDLKTLHWNRESNRGEELVGKTVGIIGYGHTGPAFAHKLKGYYCHIMVYDPYRDDLDEEENNIEVSTLHHLLQESDIVSIHVPLTDETRRMVDQSFLLRMKPSAILVNTSRGHIVDSRAVLEALRSGHLGGACLDVLENERPDTWSDTERETYVELLSRRNVLITPHIAGWTHRSLKLIAEILLQKILTYYRK